MDILSFPKTEYLLHTSIRLLQAESLDWLEGISFWKEELAFFSSFLAKKKLDKAFQIGEVRELEKELEHIASTKLDTLKNEIETHNASLTAFLLSTLKADDEGNRIRHRFMLKEMNNMHCLIRNFIRNVYFLIKNMS